MIDRYLLRYFLAVLDHGNFSRAAERCRVSQPTLSVGISKLEKAIGGALFLRTNRRVELTAAGTRFAVHARRIEAEFVQAESVSREEASPTTLRIGVVTTLPTGLLEHGLAAAREVAPTDRIEIVEGRTRDLSPMLERGRIDVLLGPVSAHIGADRILFSENYAVAMAEHHPLSRESIVSAQDLAGETMIVRRHCEALPDISRFFTGHGVRPFMSARTANDDRVIAYVRAGLGITVMPQCYKTGGIVMVSLAGFFASRTIGLRLGSANRARLQDNAALTRFAAIISEQGK